MLFHIGGFMLDSKKLKNEILALAQSKGFKKSKYNEAFIEAVSEGIISHFIKNAVVETKGSATSQIGTIK